MDGPRLKQRKQAVRERDRHRCMNCYRSGDDGDVTLDVHHIVPRGSAGSDRLSNMVLLCRQCHDAIHDDDEMAPRLKCFTNMEMDDDEFAVFKALFNAFELAKYDDEEKCWFIPMGDAKQLLEIEDVSELDTDFSDVEIQIADFM